MKKFRIALRRYRRKLRRLITERDRQTALYKKTGKRGHARQAHRRAKQSRWLRHLIAKTGRAIRRVALNHRDGVDFFGTGPSPSELKAAGKDFVVVYLGVVTRAQVDAYRAAGIDVAFVYEHDNEAVLGGYRTGQDYARRALAEANELGVPSSVALYCITVDFDIQPSQVAVADAFVDGAKSVLGARTGTYGGLYWITHCANRGLKYLWQTYAWSNHHWCPAACLRQVLIDLPGAPVEIGGHPVDYDKSTRADFGQWSA